MHYLTLKNVTSVIYIIMLAALTSLAIWDVKRIISDYIHDNRFTLVKREDINNSFPFLGKTDICLHYNKPPFFERSDKQPMNNVRNDFYDFINHTLHQSNYSWFNSKHPSSKNMFDFLLFNFLRQIF